MGLDIMHWIRQSAGIVAMLTASLAIVACGGGAGGGNAGTGTDAGGGGGDPVITVPAAPELTLTAQGVKDFHFSWNGDGAATQYRLLEDPDGASGYAPVASLGAGVTSHDHQVFLPERINARYVLQACNSAGCADSAPVKLTGSLSSAAGYFKASNTSDGANFGSAMTLSSDGSTLAVGSYGDCSAATGIDGDASDVSACTSGAVFVFARAMGKWTQQAYLKASNTNAGDYFGKSLALSSDGSTLAVGARFEASKATGVNGDQADNSAPGSGAVYVFTRSGSTWSQQAYIKASNTEKDDQFGFSLGLAADGNTLAVGAFSESGGSPGINGDQTDNSARFAGAVYVFTRTAGTWSQQAYVKASNPEAFDSFGYNLALSADGDTLAVSAPEESSSATGIGGNQADNSVASNGAVYVFTRTGTAWSQQAYVKTSTAGLRNRFGTSVALSADGNTLAVGAPYESSKATGVNGNQADTSAPQSGAVYVFTRAAGAWSQQAYIKASNTEATDAFGMALALTADGNKLAVGAPFEDSMPVEINGAQTDNSASNSGAVYVFRRAAGAWAQQAYIKAPNADANDWFGYSVKFAADGQTLGVGAQKESSKATGIGGDPSDNSMAESGAVYLY